MLRVAWWLVVSLAAQRLVFTTWDGLGLPNPGDFAYALMFYGVDLAVVAYFVRPYLQKSWAELLPLRGNARWLAVPVALTTIGTLVVSSQLIELCLVLNVLPPEAMELAGPPGIPVGVDDPSWLTALVLVAVFPAFFEEAVCRGFVLPALMEEMSRRRAIVISALYFAALHFTIERTPGTFFGGLIYGWMFVRTRSLLPSMMAHFAHNATVLLLSRSEPWPTLIDEAWVFWAALAATVVGLFWIHWTWRHEGGDAHGEGDSRGPVRDGLSRGDRADDEQHTDRAAA
jgi:membrane protease YdiL (CAAX protease family)